MRPFVFACFMLGVWCALTGPVGAADQFEAQIKRIVARDKTPGAAYAIIRNGTVTYGALGVRSITARQPVTLDTLFPLASVSKTFAGTLASKLALDGRLSLDTHVAAHYPQLRFANPGQMKTLTLAHLLSHSGGLVPNAYDNLIEAGQDLQTILPQFKKIKPLCPPGECYGYQNVLFSLAQPGLEEAGAASYADLLKSQIFAPLGMARAGVGFADYQADSNRVAPHVKAKKSWFQRRHKPNYYRAELAAGVNASVTDMARWAYALLGHRPDVVSEAAIKNATRARILSTRERYRKNWRDHVSDAWYGLGWRVYRFKGEDIILHGGGVRGIRTQISFSPDRQTALVLLLNGETRIHDEIAALFWDDIIPASKQVAR